MTTKPETHSPEDAAALVARYAEAVAADLQKIDRLAAALGELGLDAESGAPGAQARLAKAQAALDKALAVSRARQATLAVAEARHAKALASFKAGEAQRAWGHVAELAGKRNAIAAEIQAHADGLGKGLAALRALHSEIYSATPQPAKSEMSQALVESKVRESIKAYLVKVGCDWAYPRFPWPAESIPAFSETIAKGNTWILSLRPLIGDAAHSNPDEKRRFVQALRKDPVGAPGTPER